jgi:AcrR family transcriptional regulator
MATEGTTSSQIPRVLPRGRHKLDDSVVEASQRMRLIEAMTEICGERGFHRTTVADVIDRSGVSRKTFYEHFENKEDCFIAAYDEGVANLQSVIASAVINAPTWQARLRGASKAYTETLAGSPAFARMFVIEAVSVEGKIRQNRDAAFERFVDFYRELLRQARVESPELPDSGRDVFTALLGAVSELSRVTIRNDGPEGLLSLSPTIDKLSWTLLRGLQPIPDDQGDGERTAADRDARVIDKR